MTAIKAHPNIRYGNRRIWAEAKDKSGSLQFIVGGDAVPLVDGRVELSASSLKKQRNISRGPVDILSGF